MAEGQIGGASPAAGSGAKEWGKRTYKPVS
ncbi:hypothetical protein N824_29700 [Pedobacter sp. V48]|nr:hypothetical protein N824_29700 [Pedobacter sp. V48]